MSILSLHDVSLIVANNSILDRVSWQIQPHDRIALVGRNGAGKSTLLRLLQGEVVQDSGQLQQRQGLCIAGLTQDVPINENETVYHFLVKSLGEMGEVLDEYQKCSKSDDFEALARCQQKLDNLHAWDWLPKVETMAAKLDVDPDKTMQCLSGGMKRRVLLAAALIAEPDLLLLDEPTNHLDVEAIEWLEGYLKNYPGSLLVVTHDREFLAQVANRIVEIDRGQLHSYDCNYETYLDRREARREAEQKQHALFDKRLSEEEVWIRTGIKARRTRNEGRVRALKAMREAHKARRSELGQVKSLSLDVARSGNIVIKASDISFAYQNKSIINSFSFLLTRGDKVGIIGPNGCGKTTLIRLLLKELTPESGTVEHGTSLSVAYFDQLRRQLDENQTVMANVGEGSDYVTINGKQKHVASYLRDFLFNPERFNQPVSSLSGGERNRLLLAKLLVKPVNLLVMDEPTNDLDIETLELLETLLVEYTGTLLIISHDRAFINQVVTSVLIYEGNGHFNEYVGGYDDYRRYKKQREAAKPDKPVVPAKASPKSTTATLNYQEQRELSKLPQQIETLEQKITGLHEKMAEAGFYQQDKAAIHQVQQQLAEYEAKLEELFLRWDELENK